MPRPARTVIILVVLGSLACVGFVKISPATSPPTLTSAIPSIPVQTDDGLDPITLIFTGYAPSWWVAANIAGWSDTAYCSGPKTVNSSEYNFTLQHPDPLGLPCYGPRDHVRIWDMGYSPIFGQWSVGSAHHEHTVCSPLPCRHVIDSWEQAEADVRSAFTGGPTVSISNYTLPNAGYYQGIFNDGNATTIQLKPPPGQYPVVFHEYGLSNQTSWSVTLNGTSTSSPLPAIVFSEPDGTYPFAIGSPAGFNASPSSGRIIVRGSAASQKILFKTPWTTITTLVSSGSQHALIGFNGNLTISTSTVQLSTGGDTFLRFNVSEIGATGALNVTVPKAIFSSEVSTQVYSDGVRVLDARTTADSGNYYTYFTLPYGTHSVELQFIPQPSYLEYVAVGILVGTVPGVAFIMIRRRQKRSHDLTTLSNITPRVP